MTSNVTDCSQHLENQMENMTLYLEKLMHSDESEGPDPNPNFSLTHGYFNNQSPQAHAPCLTPVRFFPNVQPTTSLNYNPMISSPQYSKHMVTSVLANAPKVSSPKFVNNMHPKPKKRLHYKHAEYDPDTSDIDIDATMIELGLIPESLTPNKVHKLFSLFNDLEFAIHAEFITASVYDLKTIPNTMSVSSQIKSSIKSCQKLLFDLLEVLERPMPAEFRSTYNKCREALSELQKAIVSLEVFKHCTLEHRKGNFIGQDAEEYLEPLMSTLLHLTECVERARMFIQVYERALNCPEYYHAAILASHEGHRQPLPEETYTGSPTCSTRPHLARRYIG